MLYDAFKQVEQLMITVAKFQNDHDTTYQYLNARAVHSYLVEVPSKSIV